MTDVLASHADCVFVRVSTLFLRVKGNYFAARGVIMERTDCKVCVCV